MLSQLVPATSVGLVLLLLGGTLWLTSVDIEGRAGWVIWGAGAALMGTVWGFGL